MRLAMKTFYFARVSTQLANYQSCRSSSWYPWPTLARSEPTRMASASQLGTLNGLRAEALGDLAIGIDASLSGQIDLDRVAQIADRKYCRPHARPFRLGFPRDGW
jgi:hypothetical protein